jgi:hypothetical protein
VEVVLDRRGVGRSRMSVHLSGLVVDGTVMVYGEERPLSNSHRCRRWALNCVTKSQNRVVIACP